ncbi:MAG: hypothetical protein K8R59_05260 [Thermoanaerobaculales bacterium]|nr:hypothetical protein [Thermoanaerobaculales bacterium]
MANLSDLATYLKDRIEILAQTEVRLDNLQQKFEMFNAEVSRAREHELDQLVKLTIEPESTLPPDYAQAVASEREIVDREFGTQLRDLAREQVDLSTKAEDLRAASARDEKELHDRNQTLDTEEESLKVRSGELLERIADFNKKIAQLGRSFGFFTNFFRMRRLAQTKADLDTEQKDVAARIELLRGQWRDADQRHHATENDRQKRWVEFETDASARAAKIEALEAHRIAIVARSTVERVLEARPYEPSPPHENDPPCPRCDIANPSANAFCHICAQRLREDRPDFEGSLGEFAELDRHFHRFGEAMKAGQEIIGLVRGLKSGLESLLESVEEMLASQHKHSLGELKLEVPQWSRDFGERFNTLCKLAHKSMGLHPLDFANHIGCQTELVFTEENITAYFELIGQQMSDSADAQW